MTENWLRLSVVTVFILLAFTVSASAAGAWVLWQQQGTLNPDGSVFPWEWAWVPMEASSTESECRKAAARVDSALGIKGANTYATVAAEGKKVKVRNVCLPDTVDPRGPK